MADEKQLKILRQGRDAWNAWRAKNRHVKIKLSGSDFSRANLTGANLSEAYFGGADLRAADLRGAALRGADLSGADLRSGNLSQANLLRMDLRWSDLRHADLHEAHLSGADLSGATLSEATLSEADLSVANLSRADLSGADLSQAQLLETVFANVDLSQTRGLDSCQHLGPSAIDYRTLAKSGPLPRAFLEGLGLPNHYIDYLPSLLNEPIQFESCFISYNHHDEPFTQRLYQHIRAANLQVWYAPEDIKGGRYLEDQIDRALQIHDRLLLVLSPDSMQSDWVRREVRKGLQREQAENRRVLFPIRLVPMDAIQQQNWWDDVLSKDLTNEVCRYYIPDFTHWKDHDAFESEAAKLIAALRPDP